MKINLKLIGLIAIAAIIAFSFSACKTDNDLCDSCGNYPCSCCATCGLNPCGSWNITSTFNNATIHSTFTFTGSNWTSYAWGGDPSGTFTIECNILTMVVTALGFPCGNSLSCYCCFKIDYTIIWTIITNNQIHAQGYNYFNKQP